MYDEINILHGAINLVRDEKVDELTGIDGITSEGANVVIDRKNDVISITPTNFKRLRVAIADREMKITQEYKGGR